MSIAKEKLFVTSMEAVIKNPDLLTEILSRLPAKSLGKLKSVSKQWLSLISSPRFTLLHARSSRQPNPVALLIENSDIDSPSEFQVIHLEPDATTPSGILSLSDYLNVSMVYALQSCNGLFLCCSYFDLNSCGQKFWESDIPDIPVVCDGYWHLSCDYRHRRGVWYFVCSPTTKQFKRIPFPFKSSNYEFCLAFDPLKSPHYRIVSLTPVYPKETSRWRIDLYKSETDSWRMLGVIFSAPNTFRFCSSVYYGSLRDYRKVSFRAYYNGAIHWCCEAEVLSFSFNVETAQLKETPMPPVVSELADWEILFFGESRGHLHLAIGQTCLRPSLQFDVWEMASDCSAWFVRYRVDMDTMRIACPNLESFVILGLIRAEGEEGSILVLGTNDKAMAYNLHNQSFKEICDLKPYADASEIFHYMETITSIV